MQMIGPAGGARQPGRVAPPPRAAAIATALAAAAMIAAAPVSAQLQLGSIVAVVLDASGAPVPAATVLLTDPLGAELQRASTDGAGRATFSAVPPGRYALRTLAPNAAPFDVPAVISGALPLEITLRVPSSVTDLVVVEGLRADAASSRGSLAGASLARIPVRIRGRGLQDAVASLPGWSAEDNGLLHARGVDDGFLYVIDGVPVYERLDAVSGLAPDLASVEAVSVITGYVPPEFGHKAGGVIDIRSASTRQTWQGTAAVAAATDAVRDGAFSAGGSIGAVSARLGVIGSRSDRYLDPVHPDNLHNTGGQTSAFGQLGWSPGSRDRLAAGWGLGHARFDVPHNRAQEDAGQDQRQQIGQGFVQATWQRTWSERTVTQAAGYVRRTSATLDGSLFDTPLQPEADRRLLRTGGLVSATHQRGPHLIKAGLEWQRLSLHERFAFVITDEDEAEEAEFSEAALAFTRDNPFRFAGEASPILWSIYAQDAWQAGPRLTLSGGLRFDRTSLLLTRSQWSPRLGAAYAVSEATVLRAAVSRFYQPPQPENLLLSSSPEARVLSSIAVGPDEGGADLEPERQWGTELGAEHRWRRARVDVAYWRRRIDHAADPNVFAGTTIIFPNAVAEGRAHGVEMRVEVPRHRGWSAYANWAVGRVEQTGPITGGLFLEDEVEALGPGVDFTPDHDQRVTAGAGVTWHHDVSGVAVTIVGRHESGTPVPIEEDEIDELQERPGAERVDFEVGRVEPRTLFSVLATVPIRRGARIDAAVGVQVLNLFDAAYAYNFGNPFSGTHFGAPRTVAVTLRVDWRR